jgi:hypothetical protein
MTEHHHSAGADADQPGDPEAAADPAPLLATRLAAGVPRVSGRSAPWGDGLRMIAVTTERLAMANCSAGSAGYLPTVPPDSEDRFPD